MTRVSTREEPEAPSCSPSRETIRAAVAPLRTERCALSYNKGMEIR